MKKKRSYATGRRKALLERLRSTGEASFTLHHLMEHAGLARPAATQLASRMVDDGDLRRRARGLFELVPASGEAKPVNLAHMIIWHAPEEFCLSHLSAMAAHGLAPALPHLVISVAVEQRKVYRLRYLGGESCLNFVPMAPRYMPQSSWMEVPGLGGLPVADPEPTLLDGLRQPKRCGGLLNVARFVALRRNLWDVEMLVDDALELDWPVVIHRLGYLLELTGVRHPALERLRGAVRPTAVRLDPQRPRQHRRDPRWHVWPNVPADELRAALGG